MCALRSPPIPSMTAQGRISQTSECSQQRPFCAAVPTEHVCNLRWLGEDIRDLRRYLCSSGWFPHPFTSYLTFQALVVGWCRLNGLYRHTECDYYSPSLGFRPHIFLTSFHELSIFNPFSPRHAFLLCCCSCLHTPFLARALRSG